MCGESKVKVGHLQGQSYYPHQAEYHHGPKGAIEAFLSAEYGHHYLRV